MDLDAWLPDPDVRSRHRRAAHAPADVLWDAARGVRLDDTRTLGRLVRWRIPGTPGDVTYERLFAADPFFVLDEGDRWTLSGLVGRIWTLRRDYPVLDSARDYRAWDARGTVRVLFFHGVTDLGDGRAELVSEARVQATDRWASMRLKAIWAAIGHFERLVGAEPLTLAARRAEQVTAQAAPVPARARRAG